VLDNPLFVAGPRVERMLQLNLEARKARQQQQTRLGLDSQAICGYDGGKTTPHDIAASKITIGPTHPV
jgi:hypothetical protein